MEPLTLIAAVSVATLLIGGVALWLSPRTHRSELCLGVTVAPGFSESETARAAVRSYKRRVIVHTALALLIALLPLSMHRLLNVDGAAAALATVTGLLVAVFWQMIGSMVAFIHARRLILPHAVPPATIREAQLNPSAATRPIHWLWRIGPFAILASSAAYLAMRWNEIPARFPTHWNAAGQVDAWGNRNLLDVFLPIAIGASATLILVAVSAAIRYAPRTRATGPSADRERRIRRIGEGGLLFAAYLVATTTALPAAYIPFRQTEAMPAAMVVVIVGAGFLFAGALIFALYRADRTHGGESSTPGDRTPDACWKGGIIYYNPDDPAFWVEKRFGYGWTFNMARPAAWVAMAIIFLPIVVILALAIFSSTQ